MTALSIRIFRLPSYELFLRSHQGLAFLSLYALWRHVHSQRLLPKLYIFVAVGSFLATSVAQTIILLYRNFSFRKGCSRALVERSDGWVKINISLSRPIHVHAGQYINIWIPSISFWSFLQSHPFTILSWTEETDPMYLDLLVEPRTGFTHKLYQYAREPSTRAQLPNSELSDSERSDSRLDSRLVWFSGPHGSGTGAGDFGSVLLIATGLGIAVQLPILRELIRGFNQCEVRTRRIHLVWQIRTWGETVESLDEKIHADIHEQATMNGQESY